MRLQSVVINNKTGIADICIINSEKDKINRMTEKIIDLFKIQDTKEIHIFRSDYNFYIRKLS